MFHKWSVIVLVLCCVSLQTAEGGIVLHDPRFRVTAVAEGVETPFALAIGGGNGFPQGLYISNGLSLAPGGGKISVLTPDGRLGVFSSGLNGSDGIAFARGGIWGNDLYVAEIDSLTVSRVRSDGSHEVIASGFAGPFGPAGLAFGPGGAFGTSLYITNFSSNKVFRLDAPNAVPSLFAVVGPDQTGQRGSAGSKCAVFAPPTWKGPGVGDLFIAAYDSNINDGRPTVNGLQIVDSGGTVNAFLPPTAGLEFGEFGPGGNSLFGSNLYIANLGNFNLLDDGGIQVVDPSGNLTFFASGIDGVGLAFDTQEIFGGGLFVTDYNDGVIYQIQVIPEPSTAALLSTGIVVLLSYSRRRRC